MRKKKEEYNYFEEFANNSKYIVESAEILKETLGNYSQEKLKENITRVHKLENDADKALHRMREYLIKDFLPPIDREDIISIGFFSSLYKFFIAFSYNLSAFSSRTLIAIDFSFTISAFLKFLKFSNASLTE